MDYIKYIRELIGSRPMFMVGSGTLILNSSDEVLLIKRTDNNKWGIPGGSCELGESFEETAVREAYEETGLLLEETQLFSVFSGNEMHYIYPNGDEVYNAVCIYISKKFSGEITADGCESSDVRFFALNGLPEDFHPPDKIILKRYIEQTGGMK